MKLEQLIPLLEKEGKLFQANCKISLPLSDTEWEELASNLKSIINSRSSSLQVILGGIRVLKYCLEAGSTYFNEKILEGTFLKELKHYASSQPNKFTSCYNTTQEQQYSSAISSYIIEGFLFWSRWFPGTEFSKIFEELKKSNVIFPDESKVFIFASENRNLYINGKFQPKQDKIQGGNLDSQSPKRDQNQIKNEINISAIKQPQNLSTEEKIDQLIEKYELKKKLMFEMLENLENVEKLNQFIKPFIDIATITDGSILQHQSINEQQKNKLIEKGEMKEQLLEMSKQQISQSEKQADSQQQKGLIASNEEVKTTIGYEGLNKLKNNNESQTSNFKSSIQTPDLQENEIQFALKIDEILSSIHWRESNLSNQNDDSLLEIINAIGGDSQNCQNGQGFSEFNSKILNDFFSDRQISQRGNQDIQEQQSIITEEREDNTSHTDIDRTRSYIRSNIRTNENSNNIDDNYDENIEETDKIFSQAIEEVYKFKTKSKPVEIFVSLPENKHNIINSQSQNGSENMFQLEQNTEDTLTNNTTNITQVIQESGKRFEAKITTEQEVRNSTNQVQFIIVPADQYFRLEARVEVLETIERQKDEKKKKGEFKIIRSDE